MALTKIPSEWCEHPLAELEVVIDELGPMRNVRYANGRIGAEAFVTKSHTVCRVCGTTTPKENS